MIVDVAEWKRPDHRLLELTQVLSDRRRVLTAWQGEIDEGRELAQLCESRIDPIQ